MNEAVRTRWHGAEACRGRERAVVQRTRPASAAASDRPEGATDRAHLRRLLSQGASRALTRAVDAGFYPASPASHAQVEQAERHGDSDRIRHPVHDIRVPAEPHEPLRELD